MLFSTFIIREGWKLTKSSMLHTLAFKCRIMSPIHAVAYAMSFDKCFLSSGDNLRTRRFTVWLRAMICRERRNDADEATGNFTILFHQLHDSNDGGALNRGKRTDSSTLFELKSD